jgi:hypothetical protein
MLRYVDGKITHEVVKFDTGATMQELDGRKYDSTTEIPNRISGPEFSGLPFREFMAIVTRSLL